MPLSQGVNEQQLYAEKFGTTSLQEEVNTEGLCNIEVRCYSQMLLLF